ncbi:MAG TPA: nucleotidyltransferase family protein [Myxococcales bacterium]|nr:nucleotidyltransferase family protein [Myxococcales bacterium]
MIQVAILAGGLGTRLGPATSRIPKALVPVNGRPFLAHVLELLEEHGLKRILVCVGHHAEQLERAFGDGSSAGVQLTWHRDGPHLLGTGGALRAALDRLEDEFLVLYGDTYLDIDYGAVVRAFRASGKPALMTVFRNSGKFDASNVVFRNGSLLLYSKRHPTPEMDYIDYGLSVLRREVIAELPAGEPSDLGDLYSRLVQEGRMAGHEVFRRFYEIGTPSGLAETERYLAARR